MRYYIGAEARLRRKIEDAAMSVFESWSYEEVITPSVDYYDLFEQGMGQTEAQRGFRFMDSDGRLLALRPDVTSSVARIAATLLADRARPLRFCYAAPVFRQQTQSHAEWRRENTQLGLRADRRRRQELILKCCDWRRNPDAARSAIELLHHD